MANPPVLLWLRRDFRLADHPALTAACASGGPVIPVFIRDASMERLGAAAKLRLGLALDAFAATLDAAGSRLILRTGPAEPVLAGLVAETGARSVHWSRLYDPQAIERDSGVKAALKAAGIEADSHPGHLLFEPWTVETGQGGPYRVYSPYWRAVRGRDPGAPLQAPAGLSAPDPWPASERLGGWRLEAAMNRGGPVVAARALVGAGAAVARLDLFVAERARDYKRKRDFPAAEATSGLSEPLTWGEISPRQVWAAGWRAVEDGAAGAEHFVKELVWREFAYHLMYHFPRLLTGNWREEWDRFPWSTETDTAAVLAWKQGRTGVPLVDAAMRELWVTGRMHNRARMVVASYLTKHLGVHWKVGMEVFADMLTDWDPASNAMGWQWVAGSGPDATPYFRVFNPATQAEKFDPDHAYRRAWIAEGQADPPDTALAYFDAVPRSWELSAALSYPAPIVDLAAGRARALAAYDRFKAS